MGRMKIQWNIITEDIIRMCGEYGFYSCGTDEECHQMLTAFSGLISEKELEDMAIDIVEHSSAVSLQDAFGECIADDLSFYFTEMAGLVANKYGTTIAYY